MKSTAPLLLAAWLGLAAGTAGAAEPAKPAQADPGYCERRDADPQKCIIQDGPPHEGPIVRKRPPPPPPPPRPPVKKGTESK